MRIPRFIFVCTLLFWAVLFLSPFIAEARPVISEVFWMGSDLSTQDEWLEIAGLDQSTDVSGDKITSVNSSSQEVTIFQFPLGSILSPGDVWIISKLSAESSRLLDAPAFIASALSLPNTKLLLRIRDGSGTVLDQVDDGVGNPMAGTNVTNPPFKASMERIDLSAAGDIASNWQTATMSIGLEGPTINFGTPGVLYQQPSGSSSSTSSFSFSSSSNINSSASSASSISFSSESSVSSASSQSTSISPPNTTCSNLRISELLPDPIGDDSAEWIEFFNSGEEGIDLVACTFSLSIGSTTKSITFSNAQLGPGSFTVLGYSQVGAHLPNAGATVTLKSSGEVLDVFTYPAATEGMSFTQTDGSVTLSCVPSPGSDEAEWNPDIQLESGSLSGFDSVTLNMKMIPGNGSLSGAHCDIDFGDDHSSTSCNPGSHRYHGEGDFTLTASVTNICSTTVQRTLNVTVYGTSSSSSNSSVIQSFISSLTSLSSSSSSKAANTQTQMSYMNTKIVLKAALPNANGPDTGHEWIEIRNEGEAQGILDGYVLKTSKKISKALSGTIEAGEVQKIMAADIGLTLSNENDFVTLLRPDETPSRTIRWKKASDGVAYTPVSENPVTHIQVTRVVDGDTFIGTVSDSSDELFGEEVTVRLLGVNAPETVDPKKKAEFYGKESSDYLKELLKEKNTELVFDTDRVDIYGRWLGYVKLNGTTIQEDMLKEGYAKVEEPYPFSQKSLYLQLEEEAKSNGKGMWMNKSTLALNIRKKEELQIYSINKSTLSKTQKKTSAKSTSAKKNTTVLSTSLDSMDSKIVYQTRIPEVESESSSTGSALSDPLNGMLVQDTSTSISQPQSSKSFDWGSTVIFSSLAAVLGIFGRKMAVDLLPKMR